MDRTVYSRELHKLDELQKRAVQTIEGPVMVIAGPGTGKTQILGLRIATILKKAQCGPENILALTFTEAGAEEMRQRLGTLVGRESYQVHVHTFHGFCNSVMQSYPGFFEDRMGYNPATDVDIARIIRAGIDSEKVHLLRPTGDRYFYVNHLVRLFSELKKESASPLDYRRAVEDWERDFEGRDDLRHEAGKFKGEMKGEYAQEEKHILRAQEAAHLFEWYEKSMAEEHLYDFNDMVNVVIERLQQNSQLKQQLQERYQYILVDEHQDTNYCQNKLVELLCDYDDYPNLFVVGDEKQSIFRFQGASLENLLYFKQRFPRAQVINLENSYRSTQILLNAANEMISHASQLLVKNPRLISAVGKGTGKIPIHMFETEEDEQHDLVMKIKRLLRTGVSASDIAIIVRTNAEVETFSRVLRHYAVTHHAEVYNSAIEDRHIERLLTLLKTIHNPLDDVSLSRTLFMKELSLPSIDACRILSFAARKKIPIINCIESAAKLEDAGVQSQRKFILFKKKIVAWRTQAESTGLDRFFIELIHEIKLLSTMGAGGEFFEKIESLSHVYDEIQQLLRRNHSLSLGEYIAYIGLISEYRIRNSHPAPLVYRDSIKIMTAHKSKGTEYGHVFIPGLSERRWGAGQGKRSPLEVPWKYLSRLPIAESVDLEKDDQRRLFYVALTRAKRMVYLSLHNRNSEGTMEMPARLISEIPHEYTVEHPVPQVTEDGITKSAKKKLQIHRRARVTNEFSAFLIHRYKQNGLSVSALNNFLDCPWKYFFRNLIRMPDTMSTSAVFGSSVHFAIQQSILSILANKPITFSKFIDYFDRHSETQSVTREELKQLREEARLTLSPFFEQRVQTWDNRREAERVIRDIALDENTLLNGKIDMIEFTKGGSRVVYDFKTGKPKSRNEILGHTKNSDGSYYRQLVFYKLLLDKYKNGLMRVDEGVIEYVTPTARNLIRSERFSIGNDDVRALVEQIKRVSAEIVSLGFLKTGGCDKPTCTHCNLANTLNMDGGTD